MDIKLHTKENMGYKEGQLLLAILYMSDNIDMGSHDMTGPFMSCRQHTKSRRIVSDKVSNATSVSGVLAIVKGLSDSPINLRSQAIM